MENGIYRKLAKVLDTLPSGFPATPDGVEIKLLKKIFNPDEAGLFCRLTLNFETPEQVAERIGEAPETIAPMLETMRDKGQVFGIDLGGVKLYKMMPWVFGIYEFQMPRMDRELAELSETYAKTFGARFFSEKPQHFQVIPIEAEIENDQRALPYERVSNIIENSQSFAYFDCVCKKERGLLDAPCDRPVQVCTAYAPIPGMFDNHPHFNAMTREEARALLEKAEKEALVHLTWNVQSGHYFICNCCGCCCGVLRAINELGIDAGNVINSHYYAEIDADLCTGCGICADERCQVRAIEEDGDGYRVIPDRCIGCGLCIAECPTGAVAMVRKPEDRIEPPPQDEMAWNKARAQMRGIDISEFVKK